MRLIRSRGSFDSLMVCQSVSHSNLSRSTCVHCPRRMANVWPLRFSRSAVRSRWVRHLLLCVVASSPSNLMGNGLAASAASFAISYSRTACCMAASRSSSAIRASASSCLSLSVFSFRASASLLEVASTWAARVVALWAGVGMTR